MAGGGGDAYETLELIPQPGFDFVFQGIMTFVRPYRTRSSHFCPFCWFSDALSTQSLQEGIDMCPSFPAPHPTPPNTPILVCSPLTVAVVVADMAGAKAVGWLPVSDGKTVAHVAGSAAKIWYYWFKKKKKKKGGGGGGRRGRT